MFEILEESSTLLPYLFEINQMNRYDVHEALLQNCEFIAPKSGVQTREWGQISHLGNT